MILDDSTLTRALQQSFYHAIGRVMRHGQSRFRLRVRVGDRRIALGVFKSRRAARIAFKEAMAQLQAGIVPSKQGVRAAWACRGWQSALVSPAQICA